MQDYYKILGVSHDATISEIRRAYRKKAKLLHPDISHESSDAFRELVAAYETLTDIKSKELFDHSFDFNRHFSQQRKNYKSFDYREWLLERQDDESRAALIFFDLMHHREDEAVQEFKRMNMERINFKLSRWFTREDFMDYGFILAEELVIRKEFYDAVLLLEQIIKMEYSFNYFKFFFPEVLNLIRHILKVNIEDNLSDELCLDCWERGLDLQLGNADDAILLEKMALAYSRLGDKKMAELCKNQAVIIRKPEN